MNTMKRKNVNLLKPWGIIQYHSAVDSQGDLKLTQGKKKTKKKKTKSTHFCISGEFFF